LKLTVRGLLDGDAPEQARDVAFDAGGAIYVVGGTGSDDFPVTPGAFDPTMNEGGKDLGTGGDMDVFVTKLDPKGKVIWSTFLGGPNYDRAYAVEVDAERNVYVAGRAGRGFPTTPGALQTAFAGDTAPNGPYGPQDGFVAKLSADGSRLVWATYLGETGPGFIRDLDIDGQGRVHVAVSSVNGSDMNARVSDNAPQKTRRGDYDSFYARIAADGSRVEYGTYLGGDDHGGYYSSNPSVRALRDGTAYVLTSEPGPNAPTTRGAFQPAHRGKLDLLVAKLDPSGNLLFCTYLGGTGGEFMDTHSLAIDAGGHPVIAAESESPDYPVTDSRKPKGKTDFVVSILAADGTRLLHSTRIGGSHADVSEGVSVDGQGDIYVSGFTLSDDMPVTPSALVPTSDGTRQGAMLVLSSDLSVVRYLAYDGIYGEYTNRSSMVTADGRWAIVGATWKLDPFPSTPGLDAEIDGKHAAFFSVFKAR
jgi:hypothetical protein